MTEKCPIYHCDQCSKPIYESDPVCIFYYEVRFCAEHAVKLSDEINLRKEAEKDTDWGQEIVTLEEYQSRTATLEAQLAANGDGPACVVTA